MIRVASAAVRRASDGRCPWPFHRAGTVVRCGRVAARAWRRWPASRTARSAPSACSPPPARCWKPAAAAGCTPTYRACHATTLSWQRCAPVPVTRYSTRPKHGAGPPDTSTRWSTPWAKKRLPRRLVWLVHVTIRRAAQWYRAAVARSSARLAEDCAPGLDDLCHRFDGGDGSGGFARVHGHGADMAGGGCPRREPVPFGQGDPLAAYCRFAHRVAGEVAQLADARSQHPGPRAGRAQRADRERAGDLRRAGGRTGYGLFVGGVGP